MVKKRLDGTVELVFPGDKAIFNRQNAPVVYDMTTVCYVAKSVFVINHNSLFEGRLKAVHVPPERAIDIDNALDFQLAESLFLNRGA